MRKIFVPVIFLLCGCTLAQVQVDVLSQRTVLENQVLGTYNALDREMLLFASVRGVDAGGNINPPPRHSQEHKDALTAMQILEFHADDLQAFKRLKWVGENNQGFVAPFPMDKKGIPENLVEFADRYTPEEFAFVVAQVNQAREIIMERVIEMNETLTKSDMVQVRRIFGKLNTENALPGERIQLETGQWVLKK